MSKPIYTAGEMSVQDYEDIYDALCALLDDAEGFGLDDEGNRIDYTETEVKKCELINDMFGCMNDAMLYAERVFRTI